MHTYLRGIQAFLLFLLVPAILAPVAHAAQAGALLYPTKLQFEDNERSVTMTIKNNGDATGSYRISIAEFVMNEDGSIRPPTEGEEVAYSLKDYIRISPRRMELAPGESQTLRVMLRKPRDIDPGEYRSHLKVNMIDNNVEATRAAAAAQGNGEFSMRVATRVNFSIPVIWRNGDTDYSLEIAEKRLEFDSSAHPTDHAVLNMVLNKQGNRSVVGDLQVTHISGQGDATVVKYRPGLAMYRQLPSLVTRIPLDIPRGVSLDQGRLKITFREQDDSGGNLIAETELLL